MAKKDLSDIIRGEVQKPAPVTGTRSTLPLDRIQDRETNTRELRLYHVEALAESIAVLGLLEPLVVDQGGRLLAGGHRLAAIKLLQDSNPAAYTQHFPGAQVPVRTMGFDAQVDTERALAIEIAENEQRRDYTPSEVRLLAERLRSAGYADLKGRPTKGQKALRQALGVIVGKNLSTIRRYLNQEETEKSRSPKRLFTDRDDLRQAKHLLERWVKNTADSRETTAEHQLAADLPQVLELIAAAIEQSDAMHPPTTPGSG